MKPNLIKIKLINLKLHKSNRANLVKVAKQINGKTGSYQSHRWINPNKALDILKETLKEQGVKDVDKITYRNKDTGKDISDKELMDEYQKQGNNETIQDFVKNNYKINTAIDKGSSELPPLDNAISEQNRLIYFRSADKLLDKFYQEFGNQVDESFHLIYKAIHGMVHGETDVNIWGQEPIDGLEESEILSNLETLVGNKFTEYTKMADEKGLNPKYIPDANKNKKSKDEVIKEGLRPQELNKATRNKAMTFQQANSGNVNPKFKHSESYMINCQTCVVTFEARLRGYDLEAKPFRYGGKMEELARDGTNAWIDPQTGETPRPMYLVHENADELHSQLGRLMQKSERYNMSFTWKNNGTQANMEAHIITIYKDDNDNITIYDPQSSILYEKEQALEYMNNFQYLNDNTSAGMIRDTSHEQKIYRVDDKILNPEWINDITVVKENTTEGLERE